MQCTYVNPHVARPDMSQSQAFLLMSTSLQWTKSSCADKTISHL